MKKQICMPKNKRRKDDSIVKMKNSRKKLGKSYCFARYNNLVLSSSPLHQSTISKSSSSTINSLPLNSLTLDSSKSIAFINFSALGGCEIKTIMPANWAGGNKTESRKSLSPDIDNCVDLLYLHTIVYLVNCGYLFQLITAIYDNKIISLSSAKDASLPFLVPFSAYSAEYPFDANDLLSNFGIFSSSRNLSIADTMSSPYYLSCPFQSVFNHTLVQAWIVIPNDFLGWHAISYKLNDIANQDSCALKSWLSMADFAVSNYMLTDFNSHKNNGGNWVFKACGKIAAGVIIKIG